MAKHHAPARCPYCKRQIWLPFFKEGATHTCACGTTRKADIANWRWVLKLPVRTIRNKELK